MISKEQVFDWFEKVGIDLEKRYTSKISKTLISSSRISLNEIEQLKWNTNTAFKKCGLYLTDTKTEAIMYYLVKILEFEKEKQEMESFKNYVKEEIIKLAKENNISEEEMLNQLYMSELTGN